MAMKKEKCKDCGFSFDLQLHSTCPKCLLKNEDSMNAVKLIKLVEALKYKRQVAQAGMKTLKQSNMNRTPLFGVKEGKFSAYDDCIIQIEKIINNK